jgi:DNA recombination protein RmuC
MNIELLFVGLALLAIADIVAAILLSRKIERKDDTKELAMFLQSKLAEQNEKFVKELGELKLALQKNENDKSEELSKKLFGFFESSNKNISDTITVFRNENQNAIEALNKRVDLKLTEIGGKVEERLTSGFEKTGETFTEIVKSIAAITQAQQNIEALSTQVVSLQSILTDKKTRGIFGEKQLASILFAVFGDEGKFYKLQAKLESGVIPDAILTLPPPIGNIAVDSKFPLENYNRMFDQNGDDASRKDAAREFKINLKKHVDDIAVKYVSAHDTADMAVLFLPAEAVFAEVNANFYEIVEYAQARKVWIASPTTFYALITTAQATVRSIETIKQAEAIQTELKKLSTEFERFEDRWGKLKGDIAKVSRDASDIDVTTDKITKAFGRVEKIEFVGADA